MNYHNKKFKIVNSSENGELSSNLVFLYKQESNVLSCVYSDENVTQGQLLGLVNSQGEINMSYHQINVQGELTAGNCQSKPEMLENGKIRLHETWQWTTGDKSEGHSILEEI